MRFITRAAVLAVAVAALIVPANAMGATAPGYEEFDDCPGRGVNPNITLCVNSVVNSGHIQMGSKTVPVTDQIRISQSLAPPSTAILGSFDGGRQTVPGGLIGITGLDWLINLFSLEALKLYADAHLAGTPGVLLADPITLPLKVRLINPLLSSSCYIGSNTDPILLQLTDGTTNPPPPNQPISGSSGSLEPDPNLENVFRVSRTIVDNAFAAPRARGCTMFLPGLGLIDPLVNTMAGLPSPAGTNETVQNADIGLADITSVYPPDGIE